MKAYFNLETIKQTKKRCKFFQFQLHQFKMAATLPLLYYSAVLLLYHFLRVCNFIFDLYSILGKTCIKLGCLIALSVDQLVPIFSKLTFCCLQFVSGLVTNQQMCQLFFHNYSLLQCKVMSRVLVSPLSLIFQRRSKSGVLCVIHVHATLNSWRQKEVLAKLCKNSTCVLPHIVGWHSWLLVQLCCSWLFMWKLNQIYFSEKILPTGPIKYRENKNRQSQVTQ